MSFRVTQSMLSRNMMTNLNHNLLHMQRYQEYLTTGRKMNRPSDDPVGFNFSMRYRSELRANEQYQKNRDYALSRLETTESLMHAVNEIIQRAKELAIQGANDTNPDTARENIAAEIDEMIEQLESIANEKFQGKYVFNGEKTDAPPYNPENPDLSDIDNGKIVLQVGPGVQIEVNVTFEEVFGPLVEEGGGDGDHQDVYNNLFDVMHGLSQALRNGDTEGIHEIIGRLDERQDALLRSLASVGGRTRRLELTTERLNDDSVNLQRLLSRTEDVDIAEAITNLKMAENVYIASLSTGARIIQPSLVDFLK
jgi:flagellar hook-associated protein 3 FlgL